MKDILNKIIYGDNLVELKKIPDESIDLIYLDPPFFSGRDYEIIFGDEDKFPGFTDIWKGEDGQETRVGGIEVYKNFMRERLIEMHRILKPTGTIFLHCDKHAAHHLRLLLDEIFGANNFLNEIIWCYSKWTNNTCSFQKNHDNIYWYSKGSDYVFNPLFTMTERTKKSFDKGYGTNVANGVKQIIIYDKSKFKEAKEKYPDYKVVMHKNPKGVLMSDWWTIPIINSQAKERLGYPTQKPEALLERIIKAASDEGDIVLDPFCGCGTTIAVAKRLKRKFIGIDWSWIGCCLMAERIGQKDNDIINRPITEEDFEKMDGFEWQKYVCYILGAKSNPKERGDAGIDGWFPDGTAISVKKGPVGNRHIKEFTQSFQLDEKTKTNIGVVVGARFSKDAEEVIAKLERKYKVQIVTMTNDEILEEKFDKLKKAGIGHIYAEVLNEFVWKLPERNGFAVRKKEPIYTKTLEDWLSPTEEKIKIDDDVDFDAYDKEEM